MTLSLCARKKALVLVVERDDIASTQPAGGCEGIASLRKRVQLGTEYCVEAVSVVWSRRREVSMTVRVRVH
jgi:hypothetical protein